jgi:hypothetical protein
MQFTSTLVSIIAVISVFSSPATALPAKRSVWSPKIISPSAHTVWHHGEVRLVLLLSSSSLANLHVDSKRDVGDIGRAEADQQRLLRPAGLRPHDLSSYVLTLHFVLDDELTTVQSSSQRTLSPDAAGSRWRCRGWRTASTRSSCSATRATSAQPSAPRVERIVA